MSTFLERLEVERTELNINYVKLDSYIESSEHFKTLSIQNRMLLKNQRVTMRNYLDVLDARIEINKE